MGIEVGMLKKLVSADPGDGMLRFALGRKLFDEGRSEADLEEAITHLEAAFRLDPRNVAAAYVWAQALAKAGRLGEARGAIEAAIERASGRLHGEGHDLLPEMREFLDGMA